VSIMSRGWIRDNWLGLSMAGACLGAAWWVGRTDPYFDMSAEHAETFETSDYDKLEYIHSTLQDCEGDDGMIEISLGFVEELREPYFDYTDINGKPYPKNLIYYQPDLSDEWDVIGGDAPIHSFEVFKSKKLVEELFPDSEIMEMSGNDVENPSFIDEEFSADSGFWKMRWVIPKEAYPRHMRTTDNNWSKDFYCDEAWVERHGDEYTLNWVVRAYKPTKVQRPAESVFSKTYPYTERGWFNGYMRWAQIPMRGKNWSDEVQEKLGAFVGNRAETFNAEMMPPVEERVKVVKDVTPKGGKTTVEECIDIQAIKADAGPNYYRVKFREPVDFENFRVPAWAARAANTMGSKYYDVAGSKVTMGQLKDGGAWKIQSIMVPNKSRVNPELALKIANHIQDRLEKEGKWASKKCQDRETVLIVG
jgi:hypothetical protein